MAMPAQRGDLYVIAHELIFIRGKEIDVER